MDEGVLQQSDSKQAKLETNPRGSRRMSTPACDAGLPSLVFVSRAVDLAPAQGLTPGFLLFLLL